MPTLFREPFSSLTPGEHLTQREREVLLAVGRDMTNSEIAAALKISVRTAESHVASVLRKFNLHSRRDLRVLLGSGNQLDLPPPTVDPLLPPALRDAVMHGAFVGRQAALKTLMRNLQSVTSSETRRTIVVRGPPGIGKTRLAGELAARVQRTAVVLYGACQPDHAPYAPFAEVVRDDAARRSDRELALIMDRSLSPLVQVVPALGLRTGVALAAPGLSDRSGVVDAFDAYLSRSAVFRPLVLVIDDAHWARGSGLDVCRRLLSSPRPSRLLIMVLLQEGAPLGGSEKVDCVMTLRGLSPDAVGRILREPRTSRRTLEVHARTGGVPLRIHQLLADEAQPFPAHDIELRRLPEPARRTLGFAAVYGQECSLGFLARVLHRSRTETRGAAEAARRAGLVALTENGALRFTPTVRERVLNAMPLAEQMVAHASVARALERQGPSTLPQLVELTDHLLAAGPIGDLEAAASYSTRAGDQARSVLAHTEAAELYTQALHAHTASGSHHELEDCRLRTALGSVLRMLDDPSAEDVLLSAARLAEDLQDPTLLADVALAFEPAGGTALTRRCSDATIGVLCRALVTLDRSDAPRVARLAAVLGAQAMLCGQAATAAGLAALSLHSLPDEADAATRGHVLFFAYAAENRPSNPARAALLDQLLEAAVAARDSRLQSSVHALRADLLMEEARVQEAETELAQVDSAAEIAREDASAWRALLKQAGLAHLRGDLDAAERLAARALSVGRARELPVVRTLGMALMCLIFTDRGHSADLVDVVVSRAGEVPTCPLWTSIAALMSARVGRTAEASELLRQSARHDFDDHPLSPIWLTGILTAAEAALLVRHDRAIRAAWRHLLAYSGRLDWFGAGSFGPVDMVLAELAAAQGQQHRARRLARRAVHLCRDIGSAAYEMRSLLLLARWAPSARHAAELRRRAQALGDRLGFEPLGNLSSGY